MVDPRVVLGVFHRIQRFSGPRIVKRVLKGVFHRIHQFFDPLGHKIDKTRGKTSQKSENLQKTDPKTGFRRVFPYDPPV